MTLRCMRKDGPLLSKRFRTALGFRACDRERMYVSNAALLDRCLQRAARPQLAPGAVALHGEDIEDASGAVGPPSPSTARCSSIAAGVATPRADSNVGVSVRRCQFTISFVTDLLEDKELAGSAFIFAFPVTTLMTALMTFSMISSSSLQATEKKSRRP
jgi:hypothetical protein